MSRNDDLDRALRNALKGDAARALRDAAAGDEPIPEDMIARLADGSLPPEQEARLRRRAAFDPRAARALAAFEADLEAATRAVAPPQSPWASLAGRAASAVGASLDALRAPAVRYAVVAASAVLVTVVLVTQREHPPDGIGLPHAPRFDTAGVRGEPGKLELPWGEMLDRYDASWPLHRPVGPVESIEEFVWDPVVGAASYRLRCVHVDGGPIFDRTVDGRTWWRTTTTLRTELAVPGETWWIVEAVGQDGAILARGAARFDASPRGGEGR